MCFPKKPCLGMYILILIRMNMMTAMVRCPPDRSALVAVAPAPEQKLGYTTGFKALWDNSDDKKPYGKHAQQI